MVTEAEEPSWIGRRIVIGGSHRWKGHFGTVIGFSTIAVVQARAVRIRLDHGLECNVFDTKQLCLLPALQATATKEADHAA